MVVAWSNSAKAELRKAYNYIALDSLKSAEIVRDTLILFV
jgi:plasmid stabilization system protein ParE